MQASPSSPSSSARAATERLGARLRGLREAAGLSGVEFARRAGWRQSAVVSQVEKGRRTITVDHVRLWCRVCGAEERTEAELLTEQREVSRMWISMRELGGKVGLNAAQKLLVGDIHDRLSVQKHYQTKLVPGMFQTEAYMTGVLQEVRLDRGLELDDVAEAVAERLGRQRNLRRAGARFVFVVEEPVLWFRPYGVAVQREQLTRLLEDSRLPSVSFGVIPMRSHRQGARPRESFVITDDQLVTIELLSGFLSLTHPDEIATHRHAFDRLMAIAVHGERARRLIMRARDALDDLDDAG